MDSVPREPTSGRDRGAALIIVLAMVVLLTGLTLAYFVRATGDRQVAHGSFNETKVDQLAASAMDNIIGDLRQEISDGSASPAPTFGPAANPYYVYAPTSNANMVPLRSGNPVGVPNLIRRSVNPDLIPAPGRGSRASAVNSTTGVSANGRSITSTRWNSHYLVPKKFTGPGQDDSTPIDAFTAATPDWVFVKAYNPTTQQGGAAIITFPDPLVIGRYAYALYDEGGLLDLNVAGYPTGTTAVQSGRKGSLAFADLTALPSPIPNPNTANPPAYQIDRLVGWRNYGTTQPTNTLLDDANNANQAFAGNFRQGPGPATNFYKFVAYNTNGFLKVRGDPSPSPSPWPNPSPFYPAPNGRTDQMFLGRQQLIAFRKTTQFTSNALQYVGTFSRETNAPSFSPPLNASEMGGNDQGGIYAYRTNAGSPTAINANFLLRRVTTVFTRFDGTSAAEGEPLVKTRFPLSRLAWITYKGPSAVVYAANNNDPAITQLTAIGVDVPLSTIQAGTAANIKACFGLVWDSRAYVPASGTTPSIGQQWVYVSPSALNTGGNFDPVTNPTGNPASDIKRLDIVASENREPDFFELLRATILDGSLGQNTGGGVTGVTPPDPTKVFPDIHMSNKVHHILSIGAAIIDQADPDSIPTRVQFKPSTATTWWTGYGVESLPYITQIYPMSGISPANPANWATYLLFQLWNPHIGAALSPTAPQVRLRVDGGVGIFTGGSGQTFATATDAQTVLATGQSIALTTGAFPPTGTPTPAPVGTANATAGVAGTATAPCGFERLPSNPGSIDNYIGLRLLPDHTLVGGTNPQLTIYFGTDSTHQLNATMEYNVPLTSFWVPYNHFIGINDPISWINGDTLPVRTASNPSGAPDTSNDRFNTGRLVQSPPSCLMKADPRATRFGIFQMDTNLDTTAARILQPLWPANLPTTIPNGYGGNIVDPGGPVEHAPLRFSGLPYFPATLCINNGASTSTRTGYADNDAIVRPADATYPDPSVSTTGSSTPYYATSTATSIDYHPIILNRPFRNVAELGYAFRDLPWKSVDFFTDKSADAGLLDVFTINDGPGVWAANGSFSTMGAMPTMVAGQLNLNSAQSGVLQSVLAGAIWDELTPTNIVSRTGVTATAAPVMAGNILTATSTVPLLNKSELLTRSNLPLTILPLPSGATHEQSVKTRREAVERATSSISQTRTWNLMIDVIAQSGRYPSNLTGNPQPADLQKFVVEGEQRYWVHVAIDRFTGEVIDKQIEMVNE
jgi:hypothetical protein